MSELGVNLFFEYINHREGIRQAREDHGDPYPWTDDWIFRRYRFCNVYREDDKVTRWHREHIRVAWGRTPRILPNTVIFRMFNRIETAETLKKHLLFGQWDSALAREMLLDERPTGPHVTGSFIVKTPPGYSKLDGVLLMIDQFMSEWERVFEDMSRPGVTMRAASEMVQFVPHFGPFQAYEVITDLSYDFLSEAPDRDSWCNPGPGAVRGAARIMNEGPCSPSVTKAEFRRICAGLLEDWKQGRGPIRYDGVHMREVEHNLCEFDKYMRVVRREGTPRQIFRRPEE